MTAAAKNKPENISITAENLRYICGLNGFTVSGLAAHLDRSDTLLYLAAGEPDRYPKFYAKICALLPRRQP
jgi:hypothetical protein